MASISEHDTDIINPTPDTNTCDPVTMLNKIKTTIAHLAPKTKKKEFDKVLADLNNVINILRTDKVAQTESKILARINNILNTPNPKTRPSYAEKAAKPAVLKAFVIKPLIPGENIDDIGKKLKTQLREDKSTHIDSIVINQNNIRILSNDQQLKGKITQAINAADLNEKVDITELNKLKPQISILIPTDQVEDAETIKQRNKIPAEEDLEIVINNEIKTKSRYKKSYIVLRMSKKARQILQQKDKLYIGCESVEFRDNFNVRNCYKCNRIGHTAKYCDATPTRRRCEKEHNTKECEEPENETNTKCLFCKNAGYKNLDHQYRSQQCSSYTQAVNRLKNIIDYDYDY